MVATNFNFYLVTKVAVSLLQCEWKEKRWQSPGEAVTVPRLCQGGVDQKNKSTGKKDVTSSRLLYTSLNHKLPK